MTTVLRSRTRKSLFVCVGVSCFLVQFGVLTALARAGVDRSLANTVGFAVSAQLNFALSSRLTWRDRSAENARTVWMRLASYNGTALLSLAVDAWVFTITYHRIGNLLAAGFGVACGMCVTYLVCDLFIFRDRRRHAHAGWSARQPLSSYAPGHRMRCSHGLMQRLGDSGTRQASGSNRPVGPVMTAGPTTLVSPGASPSATVPVREVSREGLSIVMPAYKEERNLAATVADFLEVSASVGIPYCVVVVNDGSTDRTAEIAELLAVQNPGRVRAVHHEVNRGYGAAVCTGIATALALDHRWIFLTDSDGQFKAKQMPTFLDTARRERADAVVGFRPQRADPLHRRVNAFLWTSASRILLPVRVRDVDCSYKLIDRWCLEGMVLKGAAATISPEIIAKLCVRKAHIIERPVDHFPRLHGEQTGAKLSVIIRSLIWLLALSVEITAERISRRWSPQWRLPVRTYQEGPVSSSLDRGSAERLRNYLRDQPDLLMSPGRRKGVKSANG